MKFIKIFIILYSLLLIFTLFSPTKLIGLWNINIGDIKLQVYNQATTGPAYYLKEDRAKLDKVIKEKYPEANSSGIELVGNTPFHLISDPMELGDFTVYGKVVDVTYRYGGAIPVFEVSHWDVPFRNLILIKYHWFFIIMFLLFPLFIISAIKTARFVRAENLYKFMKKL
ncbi:transposase [Clostridium sp. B9]|uniref:transposase n=1 Tax=Clostridium sp. B9 TaxID=3423224 RepID=UPI003D2EE48B